MDRITPTELRASRKRLGLTQRALAALLEVPYRTLQSWELGDRAIPYPKMLMLALAAYDEEIAGKIAVEGRPR